MGEVIIDLAALKAQFAFHLESLQNLDPDNFSAMTTFLVQLGDKIKLLASKHDKSPDEIIHVEQVMKEINKFIGQLSEAQILFRKKEWNNTQAQYEKLKMEAEEGDKDAEAALKEYEPVYHQMREQMNEDGPIDFPSSSSLKFLASHFKL
jgi:hypothetical protein